MECAHAQCNREQSEREREKKHSLAQIDRKVACPCNAEGLPVIYDTADGHERSFRVVKTMRYVTKKEQVGRRNPNNSKKTKQRETG